MLIELVRDNRIVSIIGMSKNSGKTVTMNRLIEEAFEANLSVGLTSIGRDGESVDLVTETEKPKIYLESGSLMGTAEGALSLGDARTEILKKTEFRTPMGEVVIARVRESGYVQIAGPQLLSEQRTLSEDLLSLGADFVIIDGALDRLSQAAPVISDATILASGAVVSRDMNIAVEKTAQTVEALSLPKTNSSELLSMSADERENIRVVQKTGEMEVLPFKTALLAGSKIVNHLNRESKYLYISGSLTHMTMENLLSSKYIREIEIVVKDGTRTFIEPRFWNKYRKMGLRFRVLDPIRLLALTLNPYSPTGYYFDETEYLKRMRDRITTVPVMDVRNPEW